MCLGSVSLLLLGLMCVIVSAAAWAESDPPIAGTFSGLEVCPQELAFCGGKAWFAGKFVGQVGNKKHASASVLVGASHAPLNDDVDEATTQITGGDWLMVIKQGNQAIGGTIAAGGTLTYDLETNSFAVVLTLVVTQGGSGTVNFKGTLLHDPFPPEINGMLFQ
jgi:hypothetical protein